MGADDESEGPVKPIEPRRPVSIACPGACCFAIGVNKTRAEIAALGERSLEGVRMLELFVLEDDWNYEQSGRMRELHRCRAFDGERCREYAARPPVCADYPYGKECKFCRTTAHGIELRPVEDMLVRMGLGRALQTGLFEPWAYDLVVTFWSQS